MIKSMAKEVQGPKSASIPEVRPQDSVSSFTTSRGSIYTYDADGHTTRFKTKTGVEQPKQDLTVFVNVGIRGAGTIAAAYLSRGAPGKTKIKVVEQQPDGSTKVINDIRQVTNPDRLQVAAFRDERIINRKPVSLFPKIGSYVYDSRRFEEDGVTKTERHLGHKVSSIQYKD